MEGGDSTTFQNEANWWNLSSSVSTAKITQTTSTLKWLLGGQNILGPSGQSTVLSSFFRSYTNLPPHSFVGISVTVWYFDGLWGTTNNSGLSFQIDYNSPMTAPALRQTTDFLSLDGGKAGELDLGRDHIRFGLSHNSTSLTLYLISQATASSVDQSFGFRDVNIHLSNYTGTTPTMCHFSEDIDPLQWSPCPCSLSQVKDSGGTCVSCAANCDFCFGPLGSECVACSAGTYWDGEKCNTCNIMCQTCTGSTNKECPTCKYGFYLYANNTCLPTCELPFVASQVGLDLYCDSKCNSSQFYWSYNQTCLDTCDLPLVHSPDENGIEYCLNPCTNINNYLYANGSCYTTCQAPLTAKFDPGVRFCKNSCPDPVNNYLFTNRSCLSSCPSPLVSRSEPGTNYCWNPCPSTSNFLYNNGSCYSTCSAPLISRSESGVKYCYTPCPSVNDYIYDNRSCFSSCAWPLVGRTELLVAQYCLNPCGSTSYFLYPNGSCLTDCSVPLLNRTEPGAKYCFSPCSSSDYIYTNGTCKSTCPYPLMSRSEPDFNYCFTPCSTSEYLYNDQSCHSSCDSPLVKRLEPGVKYCNFPCKKSTDYIYEDGMCSSVCEYPYKVLSNPVYRVCSMNMDEIQTSQAYSLARGTDVANTICGIGGILTGFVSPGDPTSMLMWSLIKMLQFTKYMDVNFPGQMKVIFDKQNADYNGDGYMSSIGRVLVEGTMYEKRLGKFHYYDIPDNFVKNYWQQLLVFTILILLLVGCLLAVRKVTAPGYRNILDRGLSALKYNVILMFFCGSYGDLVLYSAIEFQTVTFKSAGSVISFLVCLAMVGLAVYIPVRALLLALAIFKAKRTMVPLQEKEFEGKWATHRVFFESYKSDFVYQQIFVFIYLIRVAFFNIIVGYISVSPLAQALLITMLSFAVMSYLVFRNPIKDKFCYAQQLMIETMLLVYNFCLFILVVLDQADVEAEGTRAFFGGFMVVILIIGPVATAFLIVFKLVRKVKREYYKTRNSSKVMSAAQISLRGIHPFLLSSQKLFKPPPRKLDGTSASLKGLDASDALPGRNRRIFLV